MEQLCLVRNFLYSSINDFLNIYLFFTLDLSVVLNHLDTHLVNNRSDTLRELRRRFGLIPEDLVNEGVNEMMTVIFPPVYSQSQGRRSTPLSTSPKSESKLSRPSTPIESLKLAYADESSTTPAWQNEPTSPKSTTSMAISPSILPKDPSSEEMADVNEDTNVNPMPRDNYEYLLQNYGLEIPLAYFSEGGYFPTTSRPGSDVPSPFYKDGRPVNSREISVYFEKNNVSICQQSIIVIINLLLIIIYSNYYRNSQNGFKVQFSVKCMPYSLDAEILMSQSQTSYLKISWGS